LLDILSCQATLLVYNAIIADERKRIVDAKLRRQPDSGLHGPELRV
jgi:hypothetical protein